MPNIDFWEVVLSPAFLFTTGLVMVPFGALLYSVYVTWEENKGREKE